MTTLPKLEVFARQTTSPNIEVRRAFRNRYSYGRFVLFRLNSAPLVNLYQDDEADEAARNIQSKVYLGCIAVCLGQPLIRQPYPTITLHPVTQQTSSFCPRELAQISLHPISPGAHPRNRHALLPSPPLLFLECVFPSVYEIDFIHVLDRGDDAPHTSILKAELANAQRYHSRGSTRSFHLNPLCRSKPAIDSTENATELMRKCKQDCDDLAYTVQGGDEGDTHDEPQDPLPADEKYLLYRLENLERIPPPSTEVWPDLSAFSEIGKIEDLSVECDAVDKLTFEIIFRKFPHFFAESSKTYVDVRRIALRMEWIDKVMQPDDDTASITTIPADADVPPESKSPTPTPEPKSLIKESNSKRSLSSAHGFGKRLVSSLRLHSRSLLLKIERRIMW
ncbi:hypothetical protein M422DRAFT_48325 [Sphaerobolus stellatus SS14]|uniref:Uncharacterized protein n=1 Tax=Sphaerobolus stellatus (strain SS14) TaxID=990650 RepID=A0A0C9UGB1_SPHS4|nr:hypothetical protein M422DRAFT_48325 [Sphaerobolus stellatus SS14]